MPKAISSLRLGNQCASRTPSSRIARHRRHQHQSDERHEAERKGRQVGHVPPARQHAAQGACNGDRYADADGGSRCSLIVKRQFDTAPPLAPTSEENSLVMKPNSVSTPRRDSCSPRDQRSEPYSMRMAMNPAKMTTAIEQNDFANGIAQHP